MDAIDYNILNNLQQNGRITMNKLAQNIYMSVPATCERVRKLEESGVISGYTINISPAAAGKSVNAFMLFSCKIGETKRIKEILNADPRVVAVYYLAGKYTLMIEISCKNMDDCSDLIQLLFPFGTSETYIQLSCIKGKFYDMSADGSGMQKNYRSVL